MRGGWSRGEGSAEAPPSPESTLFAKIDSIFARIRFEGSSSAGSGETLGDSRCRFKERDDDDLEEKSERIIMGEWYVELLPPKIVGLC